MKKLKIGLILSCALFLMLGLIACTKPGDPEEEAVTCRMMARSDTSFITRVTLTDPDTNKTVVEQRAGGTAVQQSLIANHEYTVTFYLANGIALEAVEKGKSDPFITLVYADSSKEDIPLEQHEHVFNEVSPDYREDYLYYTCTIKPKADFYLDDGNASIKERSHLDVYITDFPGVDIPSYDNQYTMTLPLGYTGRLQINTYAGYKFSERAVQLQVEPKDQTIAKTQFNCGEYRVGEDESRWYTSDDGLEHSYQVYCFDVTALKLGETDITVKSNDPSYDSFTANVKLTVVPAEHIENDLTADKTYVKAELGLDSGFGVTVHIPRGEYTTNLVSVVSSNNRIAYCDPIWRYYGPHDDDDSFSASLIVVAAGEVTVTVTFGDKSIEINVEVAAPPTLNEGTRGLQYEAYSTSAALIGDGGCRDERIVIGNYYENLRVTDIKGNAFFENDAVKHIVISDGIRWIAMNAFWSCSSLQDVTIPNSVTSLRSYAFRDCPALTSIRYEGTVEEWGYIEKGEDWDKGIGDYSIVCNDGVIRKDGTIEYFA